MSVDRNTHREIRTATESDLEALNHLRRVGFFQQLDTNDAAIRDRFVSRLASTRCVFIDGHLASTITMLPLQMTLGDQRVQLGGLASVQTAPEFRRQGHVRALLVDGFERLYAEGVAWSLDHPFDPAYYRRFGYKSVATGVMLALPAAKLLASSNPHAVRLEQGALDALKPIRAVWERSHNLTLLRPPADWAKQIKQVWETRERTAYLLEDAYCIFDFEYGNEGKPNTLDIHDWAYSSAAGRKNLLAFAGNFAGQADVILLHLPGDDPLVAEFSRYAKPMPAVLQARVVDVKTALEALRSHTDIKFVLKVTDDVCGWNDSSFNVTMDAGQVRLEPTTSRAHLTMDVRSLPLLLSGTVNAHAALATGTVEGSLETVTALAALSGGLTPFSPLSDLF